MIEIKINTSAIDAVLARLPAQANGHPSLMRAHAATMVAAAEGNFAAQGRPKWLGLHPKTLASRAHESTRPGYMGTGKILQRSGALANSISPWHDGATAVAGTNLIYAAIHQLGGKTRAHTILPKYKKALAFNGVVVKKVNHPGSNIPARPFLGLTPEDEEHVLLDTESYLARLFGG